MTGSEGSDFVHISATSTIDYGISSNDWSEVPTSTTGKYVRMGRGLIEVKAYKSDVFCSLDQSLVSPVSSTPAPSSLSDNAIKAQAPKRKWYQPLPKPRNISLGNTLPHKRNTSLPNSNKRIEVKSWVDTQARVKWTAQSDRDIRPGVIDIRRGPSYEGSPFPLPLGSHPSRSEISINPQVEAIFSPNQLEGRSKLASSILQASSCQTLIQEEDEDGRIYLGALGLEEQGPVLQKTERTSEDDPDVNNLLVSMSNNEEQVSYVLDRPPQIRPLPAIPPLPSFTSFPSPHSQPLSWFQTTLPPAVDHQDYVLGSTRPRFSTHYRESIAPPPPYASRYSTIVDRPPVSQEEILALGCLDSPEVRPLVIRQRDEKGEQNKLVVGNE